MKQFNLKLLMIFFSLYSSQVWAEGAVKAEASTRSEDSWKKNHIGSMDYFIYTPNNPKDQKQSLMINLHGCTQQAETLQKLGNWQATADKYNMVVAIPQVPNGGVVLGCWDYYGTDHTPENRHNKELISLIETLSQSSELNIDKNAIYISGLSSGGGEALVIGCLRPDLIAGVGLSSSPALGTASSETHSVPQASAEEMKNLCAKLAGKYQKSLQTQLAAIITSDQDFILNTSHSRANRDMYKAIHQLTNEEALDTKNLPGTRTDGEAFIYRDEEQQAYLTYIVNNQLGHNWPAGSGGVSSQFVSGSSVNFPEYLAEFFKRNSVR
ncbi:MAG TPA: PHB depolymerase family esterase [Pseudobdellovibrionaceae bacterium]|nr:PHB depolymerase family esterase [Pseudobdellovibrionaceae bacterium]